MPSKRLSVEQKKRHFSPFLVQKRAFFRCRGSLFLDNQLHYSVLGKVLKTRVFSAARFLF